jgi:hypothetical protein
VRVLPTAAAQPPMRFTLTLILQGEYYLDFATGGGLPWGLEFLAFGCSSTPPSTAARTARLLRFRQLRGFYVVRHEV